MVLFSEIPNSLAHSHSELGANLIMAERQACDVKNTGAKRVMRVNWYLLFGQCLFTFCFCYTKCPMCTSDTPECIYFLSKNYNSLYGIYRIRLYITTVSLR